MPPETSVAPPAAGAGVVLQLGGTPDRTRWLAGRQARVLLLLVALLAAAPAAFLTLGAQGSWSFVLAYRGEKLLGLVVVAVAIGVSTVLFQTVTANRILTPSLLGMDTIFVLVQTALVSAVGAQAVAVVDDRLLYVAQVLVMVGFALALFRWLFTRSRRSLHLLLLVGVVLGTMLRAATTFLQRVMDPNDFIVLTSTTYASFGSVDATLLGVSAVLVAGGCVVAWRLRHRLDVLSLGRELATGLGVDHTRTVTTALVVVAVLVSVSTALVGPVTFLGLLVANLAHVLLRTHRHALLLPGAAVVGALTLVLGQTVLERVLGLATTLGVVVELVGGVVFVVLLLRKGVR